MAEVSAAASTSVDLEPVQLVAPDGAPTSEDRYTRDLPPETLSWLYELMVVTRALDGEFINLQRQGELALFASCFFLGQGLDDLLGHLSVLTVVTGLPDWARPCWVGMCVVHTPSPCAIVASRWT